MNELTLLRDFLKAVGQAHRDSKTLDEFEAKILDSLEETESKIRVIPSETIASDNWIQANRNRDNIGNHEG